MIATAPAGARVHHDARGTRTVEHEDRAPAVAAPTRLHSLGKRLEDWACRYPDAIAVRIMHRAPTLLWRLGLGRFVGDLLLTTRGRSSGLPRRAPLTAHRIGGRLYAWDPYAERAHWYRNLVVDPIVTIQDVRGTWTAQAVHPSDHAEAITLYRQIDRAIGRRFHEYLDDHDVADTPAGFADAVERLHVVRFDPVPRPGPASLPADLVWIWPLTAAILVTWWVAMRGRRA